MSYRIDSNSQPPQTQYFSGRTEFPGISLKTGDFASYTPDQTIHIIARNAEMHYNAITTPENRGKLSMIISQLEAKNEAFRDWVINDAHYPPQTKEKIISRYLQAERIRQPLENSCESIARRMQYFPGPPQIISDMDGTITKVTPSHKAPPYEAHFPGNSIMGPLQEQDSDGKRWSEYFASSYFSYLQHAPELFREAAKHTEIREGVNGFLENSKKKGIEVQIVSASYDPFVVGVLEQIPNAEGIKYVAVKYDDITARLKDLHIRHAATSNPDNPLLYIGDGATDKIAINAQAYVAGYFALRGGSFEKELQQRKIEYIPYETFYDITEAIEKIEEIRSAR